MNGRTDVPKVGDELYVPTKLYLSRGCDDVLGGRAKVCKVEIKLSITWVYVEEHPGHGYNWEFLQADQEKLRLEYGDQRARPNPDNDPSANEHMRWRP